jgi:tetratricopeptide (TPR) repeat protein
MSFNKKRSSVFIVCLFILIIGLIANTEARSKKRNIPPFQVHEIIYPVDAACYIAYSLDNQTQKAAALAEIASKYEELGQKEQAKNTTAALYKLNIPNSKRVRLLSDVTVKVAARGGFSQAISIADEITVTSDRDIVLEYLYYELEKLEMYKWAEDIVEKITSPLPRSVLFVKLAKIYADEKQIQKATQLANKIDTIDRDKAIFEIIKALTKDKQFKDAYAMLDKFIEYTSKIEAKAYIAAQIALTGDIAKAKEAVQKEDPYVQELVYSSIAVRLAKNKKFQQAVDTAFSLQSPELKEQTLAAISVELAADENFQDSKMIVKSLNNRDLKDKAFINISKEHAKFGEFDDALATMGMVSDQSSINKELPNIAAIFGQKIETHYSLLLIKQLNPKSVRLASLKQYTINYAAQDKFNKLAKVINEIEDKKTKEETLSIVINNYMKQKKYILAKNCIALIEEPSLKAFNLIKIGKAFNSISKTKEFSVAISEAKSIIEELPQNSGKVDILIKIADIYFNLGQEKEGVQYIDKALDVAYSIRNNPKDSDKALTSVIVKYSSINQRIKGLNLINRLKDKNAKISALISYPTYLHKYKDKDRESGILRSIAGSAGRY